ncbi:hypothetical protein [Spiroplasma ixodetis]|uniref:Transposase n=1 Tax=Spiroplasma ixodetis TaxID=2141 RepID=A0ABM8JM46_9MOLU
MSKKQNINNNYPISKAVDLLLENTEDLTTVFKEGGLYKALTKRLVEKKLPFHRNWFWKNCQINWKIW